MTYSNIGSKIKFVRSKVRDYTQDYMASKLGISQNTYCKIENGQINPTLERLEEIANILEIPIVDLLSINEHIVLNNCINSAAIVNGNMINNDITKLQSIFKQEIDDLKADFAKQFDTILGKIKNGKL